MKKITTLLSLTVLFSLFIQSVTACGPFTVEPLFSFTRHADYPLQDYAKGKIGIVPTSYGRMSLFVFYRELNDLPLSAKEQTQITEALSNRIGARPGDDESTPEPSPQNNAVDQWKASRAKVFVGDPKLEKEKRYPDNYFYYTNCLDDSFRTAANTLEERIKQNGINDNIKEWLNGQDAVFANCGDGGKIPENVADNAPDWLKKDRAYQIAAATLYSGKDAEARAEFFKISNDSSSPWSKTAKFVVARTYIREASLIEESEPDYSQTPDPNAANIAKQANDNVANLSRETVYPVTKSVDQKKSEKRELYQKAETNLKEILADDSMKEFHASANRLLGLVGFRAKPREQRRKLAENLVQKMRTRISTMIWLITSGCSIKLMRKPAKPDKCARLKKRKKPEKSRVTTTISNVKIFPLPNLAQI